MPIGFEQTTYSYYRDPSSGDLQRLEYKATGLKFLVQTKGVGRSFLVDAVVLQVSLGVALLKLAVIIVDLMMLHVFPSKRSTTAYLYVDCYREEDLCQGEVLDDRRF